MLGFTEYNVDVVIKFGGSLIENDNLNEIINSISALADEGKRIVIVPGGGPTDNAIEKIDEKYRFHEDTHHYACARAQDQTGLMISDANFESNLIACEDMYQALKAMDHNKVAVMLPSKIIFAIEPFKRTWDITSDSMALWFSWLVHCDQTIILTNVDGIYSEGNIGDPNYLHDEVRPSELAEMGHTAVDQCAANFIEKYDIDCWVLNGGSPDRIIECVNNGATIGTKICKEAC